VDHECDGETDGRTDGWTDGQTVTKWLLLIERPKTWQKSKFNNEKNYRQAELNIY